MPELVLGPMLRYVSSCAATIWVEVTSPCRVGVITEATGQVDARTFACNGHHYALVVLDSLEASTVHPYSVVLDGQPCWPLPDSPHPAPAIRTYSLDADVNIAFGSCRAAAPHHAPFDLDPDADPQGKGVDALHALALGLVDEQRDAWPHLLLFLGDQVYADEASPATRARADMEARPGGPPSGIVADFEQYTWLYHESWSGPLERWLLSTVPTAMIFDDHDTIDDWNISESWVRDTRALPWWSDHIVGGMVSYWIYQHLGNLSPERIEREGMLADLLALEDGTDYLYRWARRSEEFTPLPGGYPFSFDRHVGTVHIVMLDSRNGRVLAPGARRMIDAEEWAWACERVLEPCRHLVLASSLPVFVPGGLHGIQQWNEALCDGVRGRLLVKPSERLRRALDIEHWPAFNRSFRELEELLQRVTTWVRVDEPAPPRTVSVLGGDVHFAYVAKVMMPAGAASSVRQIVSSPMRNSLARRDRSVLRFAIGRLGRRLGAALARFAARGPTALQWELESEAIFGNNIGLLCYARDELEITVACATRAADGRAQLTPVLRTKSSSG